MKTIDIPEDELDKFRLHRGDLLVTEGGDWDKVGRTAIWHGEIDPCVHQNHVFRVRLASEMLDKVWVMQFINSDIGRSYFAAASKQTTNLASINMTQLRSFTLAVPPLAEQKRIISKVDQLMTLCDELETKLTHSQTDADALAASLVQHLCNPNTDNLKKVAS